MIVSTRLVWHVAVLAAVILVAWLFIDFREAHGPFGSIDELVGMLDERVKRTYILGVLDTLEYLRRSGRVNWAQFGIGTLLRIKPLLHVHMGQVEIPERIRTSGRARQRMLELATALGPLEDLETGTVAVVPPGDVTSFLNPEGPPPLAVELTPAIGAHVGPGAVGIACVTAQG